MDQREYWSIKWGKEKKPPNRFARKSYLLIKSKNLKDILDLGCGDGRDSFYFANRGLNVTAVDFSESGINHIKEECLKKDIPNIVGVNQRIEGLNLGGKMFDIIYAHLSLHYFNDRTTTQIFKRLYDSLNEGGLFFLKCKSKKDYLYGKGKKIGDDMFDLEGHIRHFFDKDYMREKLKRFKVLKIRRTSSVYRQYKSSFIEAIAMK